VGGMPSWAAKAPAAAGGLTVVDREALQQHLARAEQHIAECEQHITRQREIIAQFERDGHDAATARQLLKTFEELLAMHIANRHRLLDELKGKA
jgi:uncharacterized membrane protein